MRRLRWAMVAGPTLAGFYLAVAGWMTSGALGAIVDVEGPLAGIETHRRSPFELNYDGNPRQAFGYDFEDVTIATELGAAPAWLVPGKGGATGDTWALYAHGIAGRRESGYKALSVLHDLGVPTLLMSYRNDAGAPAAPEGIYAFGVTEWRDLDAAAAFAVSRGATRLLLAGDSMGGAIIGRFMQDSRHAALVAAIALDAPALDIRAVVRGLTARIGFPLPGLVAPVALTMMKWRLPVDMSDAVTLPRIAAFDGPVFLAHGDADDIVPVAVGDELVARRAAPTVYLRTGAGHVLSWQAEPELYRAMLAAFFEKAIRR